MPFDCVTCLLQKRYTCILAGAMRIILSIALSIVVRNKLQSTMCDFFIRVYWWYVSYL